MSDQTEFNCNTTLQWSGKLWFYYSGTDSFKNREKTLQSKTFGVPFNFRQKERFQDIRKGDLFCFIGPFKNMRGGRIPFDEFKKNRKLICKDLTLIKITTDYFYDENEIWEHKVNYLTEDNLKNYPHRFNFDTPILNLKDIKVSGVSFITVLTQPPQNRPHNMKINKAHI